MASPNLNPSHRARLGGFVLFPVERDGAGLQAALGPGA